MKYYRIIRKLNYNKTNYKYVIQRKMFHIWWEIDYEITLELAEETLSKICNTKLDSTHFVLVTKGCQS